MMKPINAVVAYEKMQQINTLRNKSGDYNDYDLKVIREFLWEYQQILRTELENTEIKF